MEHTFGDLINKAILVYLDDITIFSNYIKDHIHHLKQVFEKCIQFEISINPKKSVVMVNQGKLLGHIVLEKGLAIDLDTVKVIEALPLPSKKKTCNLSLVKSIFLENLSLIFFILCLQS